MVNAAQLKHLIEVNSSLWMTCQIDPKRLDEVNKIAKRIQGREQVYATIETETRVPWWAVGIIHYREADLDFECSIAQGDPWNKVSTHVPRGCGPFKSWHDAAVDALVKRPPRAAAWADWSYGGALTLFETYNGLGYEMIHHENSPYNWGATNHEERGKYVADGKYDPAAWDNQIGCAALLKALNI